MLKELPFCQDCIPLENTVGVIIGLLVGRLVQTAIYLMHQP